MKPHSKTILSSLFLLLSLYKSSTSLVGRCCLRYVNLHSDTSDACIKFHGLVSNRSHSHANYFPGRQPFLPRPLQSSLPLAISVLLPMKIRNTAPQEHILNQTHHNQTTKHPPQTQCRPPSPTCTPKASSARSRKTASSAPTSTRPSPTQ
jgi:hypothetical protein